MRKYRFLITLILVGLLLAACKAGEEAITDPTATAEEEVAVTEPTEVPAATDSGDVLINSAPSECRVLQDPIFPYPYASEDDWSMGPEDATVTMIVYTDLQCPACAYYHPAIETLFSAHAEDTRLVIRHFPLDYHANARVAAQAAESVGRLTNFENMFEFMTALFASQTDWQDLEAGEFLTYVTDAVTTNYDITVADFEEMLTSQAVIDKIDSDIAGAQDFITGTPWIMINGIPLMYMPVGSFEEAYTFAQDVPAIQYDTCPEITVDAAKEYTATVDTSKGTFVLKLYPESAPMAVNSFVFLSKEGYFDNIPFHRVIPNFVAQAGDFTGTGIFGPGYEFDIEIDPNLSFDRAGILGMANSGPDHNGSQWFVTYAPQLALDGGYTIFGEVVDGMDVVTSLQAIDPQNDTEPVQPDVILSITIEEN